MTTAPGSHQDRLELLANLTAVENQPQFCTCVAGEVDTRECAA